MVRKISKTLSFLYALSFVLALTKNSFSADTSSRVFLEQNYPVGQSSSSKKNQGASPLSADSSQDQSSNAAIFREIERSLIFNQQSLRNNTGFYAQPGDDSDKANDITIESPDVAKGKDKSKKSKDSPQIGIVVVNPKLDNLNIRDKERLAYNSASIDQYEVAITLYKEVLAAERDNSYAKFSLAVIYQKLGQFRQAKSLYYQLLKSAPDLYDQVITNLLTILIEESPKEASYMLSRLVSENPDSGYVSAQAAIAYEKIKEHQRAVSLMSKAVNLEPENMLYRYNLAVIYDKMEKFTEALEVYSTLTRDYDAENDREGTIPIEQVLGRIKFLKNKVNSH